MTEWAEIYTGSRRLTGRRAAEPVRCADAAPAPTWVWVGDMSDAEFNAAFVAGEHDICHSPSWSDRFCPHCQDAGWIEDCTEGEYR